MTTLTQTNLKHLVFYDEKSGQFFYRNRFHSCLNGIEITSDFRSEYFRIKIEGMSYAAHRLAWLYMTGAFPKETIDHIDMDKYNNRFANLREATRSQQKANARKRVDSSSKYKCVSWRPRQKKWSATICKNGKRRHLGYFETAEIAHAAYVMAAKREFGEFARSA